MYTKICLRHKLFGEMGANFPVQLSSRSHFAKIENKSITENQCEKHKN